MSNGISPAEPRRPHPTSEVERLLRRRRHVSPGLEIGDDPFTAASADQDAWEAEQNERQAYYDRLIRRRVAVFARWFAAAELAEQVVDDPTAETVAELSEGVRIAAIRMHIFDEVNRDEPFGAVTDRPVVEQLREVARDPANPRPVIALASLLVAAMTDDPRFGERFRQAVGRVEFRQALDDWLPLVALLLLPHPDGTFAAAALKTVAGSVGVSDILRVNRYSGLPPKREVIEAFARSRGEDGERTASATNAARLMADDCRQEIRRLLPNELILKVYRCLPSGEAIKRKMDGPLTDDRLAELRILYNRAGWVELNMNANRPPEFPVVPLLPADAARWLQSLAKWADAISTPVAEADPDKPAGDILHAVPVCTPADGPLAGTGQPAEGGGASSAVDGGGQRAEGGTPADPPAPEASPRDVVDAKNDEGKPPAKTSKTKLSQDQTNALVADWFRTHQNNAPKEITRDRIATDTGASTGGVSKSPMWIAFSKNKAVKTSTERTVPLTNAMLAVVPNESDTPDELAALIEEQAAEKAEDERRHTRRHGSS
jgi:hypothetical protein